MTSFLQSALDPFLGTRHFSPLIFAPGPVEYEAITAALLAAAGDVRYGGLLPKVNPSQQDSRKSPSSTRPAVKPQIHPLHFHTLPACCGPGGAAAVEGSSSLMSLFGKCS